MRIPARLVPLLDHGIIEGVVRPLMSGKEAEVYIVSKGDGYFVAKVYKDAQHRSFRQRVAYTEGRQTRSSRKRRAMEKGSRYGKEQTEAAWQTAEVDALHKLGAAGIRVPRAIDFFEGVLVMDLVLDSDGQPAPRFCDCPFTPDLALRAHRFLVRQVSQMLCAGIIHGDLSEYNVLLAWDGPMIIDLPQAVDAAHNQSARAMLIRDVDNVTSFLARFVPSLTQSRYGQEIWSLYERAQLFPDTPLTGRWRDPSRRADTRAVMREIDDEAREARMRRR